MIGTTVSQYRIEVQLGEGGMGIVYRAFDTKLDRQVALKFLPQRLSNDPEAKARFVQEAKAASGLDHPNICTIYDIGEAEDGSLFIAMAFYDGQTLKYALQDGAMPPAQAASIGAQIVDGLRKAHSAEIVHRDIKPANIMVTSEGRVKILDFGVAMLVGGAELMKAGSTVGTTAYMSPEQARGEAVDARADLWSLGVLMYEMLSGEKPFGGEYEQAIFYSVLNETPKPLPDTVPEELATVVTKLLAKSSADRFQSAGEVLSALDQFERVLTDYYWAEYYTPIPGRPTWLFFAGEILKERGRYDDALKYLDKVSWMSVGQFIVPATIGQAEIQELSGDLEGAVKSYERVPVMWSGADEALQPIVDQARERRDELLVRLGREPASLPAPSAGK